MRRFAIGLLELALALFGDWFGALVLLVALPVGMAVIFGLPTIGGAIANGLGLWSSPAAWVGSVLVAGGFAIGLVLGIRFLVAVVHWWDRFRAQAMAALESADGDERVPYQPDR